MKVISHHLFENFTPRDASTAQAKAVAEKFVADIEKAPFGAGYMLTLSGRSGTGKTMLENCILNALKANTWGVCARIQRRQVGSVIEAFEYQIHDWRKISDGFKAGNWGLVEMLEEPNLLIVDDVGSEYDPNSMSAAKLDRILRSRRDKWTVVSTNLSLREVADKMDTRIASFMIRDGNKVIEIKCQDYALDKNKPK